MAIQMTRQEYEAKYGVQPVIASSSVLDDEKPAPIRMTREEYNSIYYSNKSETENSLGTKLKQRGKDLLNAGSTERTLVQPLRPELRAAGAVAGAGADIIGAAISPIVSTARDFLADQTMTEQIASSKPVGNFLDITNKATDFATESWKAFEEKNPTIAQDIKDFANIASFFPGPKVIKPVVSKADDIIAAGKATIQENSVKNVVDEIAKIEKKYVKTRNANNYEKDIDISRRRIAESNVLADAVDADGIIRTKGVGGAIDQYKKQTIDGMEDIVKQNLELNKEVMNIVDVRKALVREIGKSGLEGADLVSALKKVDSELAGLAVRTRGSSIIDLGTLHDAKIATTKNINYLTPPEKATYRKAIARAYKTVVEENSKKFDVKTANETLSKYYKDIARLERLDGARAEGGRLGKISASLVGTGIGMAAGSTAGGLGAAVGGVIGGEAAQALKGMGMSRTFKGGGKGLAKDPVLVRAKLSIPDKPVKAKANVPKTKEIKEVESQIAKNVAAQKRAIKAGDFTLVQALKEVYVTLVEELKKLVKEVVESAKNPTIGLSIKKSVTQESVAKKADKQDIKFLAAVVDDVKGARTSPEANRILDAMGLGKATDDELVSFAKEVIDEADIAKNLEIKATPETTALLEEAKKYKSAEEFVKAQGEQMYRSSASPFDVKKMSSDGIFLSPDKAFVENWKKSQGYQNFEDFVISPQAKILRRKDFPERFVREEDGFNFTSLDDQAEIIKYAKDNGFDGIEDYSFRADGKKIEHEFAIWNKDVIKTRTQLEDIWKQANRKASEGGR